MLRTVRASDPRFRTVRFSPGFNVVLAVESEGEKESRNGVGKTTLLQIIHFCLGSSIRLASTINDAAVRDWTYTLELDVAGMPVSVSRTPSRSGVVALEGDFSRWPISPLYNDETRQWELSVSEWNNLLGHLMLGLPLVRSKVQLYPTWRAIAMYFLRLGHSAYASPFVAYSGQSSSQQKVYNAFLLGLNWEYALEWNGLKLKSDLVKSVQKATDAGVLGEVMPSIGELQAHRVRLKDKADREAERLSSFQVLDEYHEIQEEANGLTRQMQELTNTGIAETNLVRYYEEALTEHSDSLPSTSVEDLFRSAAYELAEGVVRRLEEVKVFHEQLVRHRATFLKDEVSRLRRSSGERSEQLRGLAERRTALMQLLQTHGALEEYTALQELHSATLAQLGAIDSSIEQVRRMEEALSEVRIDQQMLYQSARRDLVEREPEINEAIRLFNQYSQFLYQSPGNLVVDLTDSGYKFDVEIERSGSEGIGSMKIFCYDLMISTLWSVRDERPGFLVHDSTMYDPVDERQVARALRLAAAEAGEHGFQYICMLNSDKLPSDRYMEGFRIDEHVAVTLSDATPEDSLLGVRF